MKHQFQMSFLLKESKPMPFAHFLPILFCWQTEFQLQVTFSQSISFYTQVLPRIILNSTSWLMFFVCRSTLAYYSVCRIFWGLNWVKNNTYFLRKNDLCRHWKEIQQTSFDSFRGGPWFWRKFENWPKWRLCHTLSRRCPIFNAW